MRLIGKTLLVFALLSGISIPATAAEGKLKIVTTTSNFADFAKNVAGPEADIYFIALPQRDIHFITPNPKDIVKLRKADVFIHGGLDLEVWRAPMLEAVGRTDFITGEKAIDASQGISLMEVPHHPVSRLEGDVHLHGNPHYWNDPRNAVKIVDNIARRLSELYPEKKTVFLKNAEVYKSRLEAKMKDWQALAAPYRGQPVFIYHNDLPYFLEFFGFETADFLEPKAGIPPTAKHIEGLIKTGKEKQVRVIIKEAFHESRTPKKIAKAIGAAVVTLSQEAGESKEGTYLSVMEDNIRELTAALGGRKE